MCSEPESSRGGGFPVNLWVELGRGRRSALARQDRQGLGGVRICTPHPPTQIQDPCSGTPP